MKTLFLILVLTIMLVVCAKGDVNEKEFVFDETAKLIDVRTEKEFNEGHLKNAINIPHEEIKEKIKEHVSNPDEKIVLYCRSGGRAGIAKKSLEEMGYKNVTNAGGYEKLKKIQENQIKISR